MVVVDGRGVPLGDYLHAASPAEVRLAETTLAAIRVGRRHHPGRRRDIAQRVGGWGYLRHPTCSTRRTRGALDRGPSQAQTAEVGRGGAGQQGGPRRLEADGQWSMLLCEIGTHRVGACRIEISQTRGAIQLQPC